MKNLFEPIKSWLTFRVRARFRIRSLERRCDALERDRTKAEESIDRAAEAASVAYSRVQATITTAQSTVRQQADTIQDLRSTVTNQALEIDQLVSVLSRNHERVKAETEIAIREQGQVALNQSRDRLGV